MNNCNRNGNEIKFEMNEMQLQVLYVEKCDETNHFSLMNHKLPFNYRIDFESEGQTIN